MLQVNYLKQMIVFGIVLNLKVFIYLHCLWKHICVSLDPAPSRKWHKLPVTTVSLVHKSCHGVVPMKYEYTNMKTRLKLILIYNT